MVEPLKVGLAGLGTVGASVVRLLELGRDKLKARCGRPIEIVFAELFVEGRQPAALADNSQAICR